MCDSIVINGGNVSIQITGGQVTAAGINSAGASIGQVLTADGAGGAAWEAVAGGGPGYLEYVAYLTQSGTSDPVAVVLKNTLGAVVWSRTDVGLYQGTLNGAFSENKTLTVPGGSISIPTDGGGILNINRLDANSIAVEVANDGILGYAFAQPIEIRVYP